MTDSPDNPNRWIDGELRRVPLPDGLLARLRKIAASGADDELDEQLCAVGLPDGLLARLDAIVDDEPLDRRIADVPLPDGLLARLAQIPDDEILDEAIRDVPVPAALVPSTVAAARSAFAASAMRRWSVAAAVMIAVGAAYFVAIERWSRPLTDDAPSFAQNDGTPPDDADFDPFGELRGTQDQSPGSRGWEIALDVLPAEDLWADAAGGSASPGETLASRVLREFRRPSALDVAASWPRDYDYDERGRLFTARLDSMDLPPLEAAPPLVARGIEPPTTPGYDRLTLARSGVHPFVDPAAHPLLESSAAPLVRSTASFDALLWRLRDEAAQRKFGLTDASFDVLSAANVRVRTEEFLAAMRYDFSPPTSTPVAIRTAAGPSPFAAANVRLLQVGVQAAMLAPASRTPVELILAVDVSHRMGQSGRLEIVRQALFDALDRLRGEDRVSLVAYGATASTLIVRSAPGNPGLRRAIAELAVEQGSNFHAGVERAARIARESAGNESSAGESPTKRRQIVLFADAPTFVSPAQRAASRRAIAAAVADDVAVTVVDVSQSADGDDDLTTLAEVAKSKLQRVASAADLNRCLDEALFERSTVVAQDVELSLRFNPRAVAAYRLVGHEATIGLPTAPVKVSLRSGEAAAVLFEIVLRDEGTNDVGVAELEWIDPATRKPQLLTQPISRVQFANSLAESSISLQAAAVAAEAAEILRGARAAAASQEHSLDRTLQVARAVHPRLRQQSEFRALVDLIRQAREAGLGHGSP
ncbi:MAG: VWA domain-containing protein [Pirellulales bacterium]